MNFRAKKKLFLYLEVCGFQFKKISVKADILDSILIFCKTDSNFLQEMESVLHFFMATCAVAYHTSPISGYAKELRNSLGEIENFLRKQSLKYAWELKPHFTAISDIGCLVVASRERA